MPLAAISRGSEAQRIIERLNTGEDFASITQDKSTDPSAPSGGYLGRIDPGRLRPELSRALQGVGPGQMSGMVRIPSGYAILKVLKNAPVAITIPPECRPCPDRALCA